MRLGNVFGAKTIVAQTKKAMYIIKNEKRITWQMTRPGGWAVTATLQCSGFGQQRRELEMCLNPNPHAKSLVLIPVLP